MLAALLTLKMQGYDGFYGLDINPERIPVERALVLSMNALEAGCTIVNELDYDRLVEAMYSPQENRGVVEDVLTRALAPKSADLKDVP